MNTEKKPVVALAMSGGVDSSVAAALLQEQGYPIFGITMRLPSPADLKRNSAASEQIPSYIHDARLVAQQLGFEHHVVDVREAFTTEIIDYFCEEYRRGRTPNPCVVCNPRIKFGRLFDSAKTFGAERLATGHYVQKAYHQTYRRELLKAASNTAKDQSYFLYRLTQAQLARAFFPLAMLTKDAIRAKARALDLHQVAEKAESQENCFLADQRYQDFLAEYLSEDVQTPGPIVDTSGRILGEHQGIYHYTIGQRRGLGLAFGTPRYVIAIRPETNTVVIGENHELFTSTFVVGDIRLLAFDRLSEPFNCQVKIRYRHTATPATIWPGAREDEIRVELASPQRAVTPGQSAVFYDGEFVLGGGIIEML